MYTTLPNGIKVFYREAGSKSAPVVLLLHGFPSSSHQYVKLINLLAPKYHVIAPDLPGFGFTEIPSSLNFEYNFANLATTTASFLDVLGISKFAVYIFDYGAPTALRLALQRPEAITAIISQNGNAYEDGFGDFWNPLKAWWETNDTATADFIRNNFLNLQGTKGQYTTGEPDADVIDPATYYLDWVLLERPGNKDIQLKLLMDYPCGRAQARRARCDSLHRPRRHSRHRVLHPQVHFPRRVDPEPGAGAGLDGALRS